MAELVVTAAEGGVTKYPLQARMVIGRHPDCEVVLTDPMSSRRHCRLELGNDGQYYAEDNGSANGTLINGEALRMRRLFREGDILTIGSTRIAMALHPGGGFARAVSPNQSVLNLREDGGPVNFDFTLAAGAQPFSEAEASTSDLRLLQRLTARLKTLLDLGQSLGSTLDCHKLLATCLDQLFNVFPQAERGFILLYGPGGELPTQILQTSAAGGLEERKGPVSVSKVRNPGAGRENEVAVSRTVVNRVRASRQSVLISDSGFGGEFSPAMSMVRLEIQSVMCAPLVAAEQDLGILYLDTKEAARRFNQDDLQLLNAVAGQVAIVIKNAELAAAAATEAATRQNLQRYLSPHLVERILRKDAGFDLLQSGGMLKTGTVFFSDIVGFTRMASRMRPPDVVALLNRYFKVMQEIIFDNGGTVDKTGGDAIMAFWGVFIETPHAPDMACQAALEMQNALFALNRDLAADPTIVRPPEPLGHGIGLNTGEFVAGNLGSERKVEFTVIGGAVNLAQRLESLAGRGEVFVGRGTYEAVQSRALAFRMPDTHVKNVDRPIEVYSVRGLQSPDAEALPAQGRGDPRSSFEELVYSLPCVVGVVGRPQFPPVVAAGVVTGMLLSPGERQGRFQVLVEHSLPQNAQVQILWQIPEKPSLEPVFGMVEQAWEPQVETRSTGPSSPTVARAAHAARNAMVVYSSDVPASVLALRPGALLASDLTSAEQMVRV